MVNKGERGGGGGGEWGRGSFLIVFTCLDLDVKSLKLLLRQA